MTDLTQAYAALKAADAAGNVEDATQLANYIKNQSPAPAPDNMGTIGNVLMGGLKGASNIGATLLRPVDYVLNKTGLTDTTNEQRRNQLNQFFNEQSDPNSLAFKSGQLGSEIAGTAGVGGVLAKGVSAIPALARMAPALASGGMVANGAGMGARIGAGALTGAGQAGLINPDDALTGAALGGSLPVVAKGAGALGSMFSTSPESKTLAMSAMKEGIPVGASDVAGGKMSKALNSVLNDIPVIGQAGQALKDSQQTAFNKSIASRLGVDADKITPEVLTQANQLKGKLYDQVWGQNDFKWTPEFQDKIAKFYGDLDNRIADKSQLAFLKKQVGNLAQDASTRGGELPGDYVNNFQSRLGENVGSGGAFGNAAKELRSMVRTQFKDGLDAESQSAWKKADDIYNALKVVEPVMAKANEGVAGRVAGDFPPAMLSNAVASRFGGRTNSFGDLPQIGSNLIADRAMQTGGSPRALIQSGALGAGLVASPVGVALGIPAAFVASHLLNSTKLAERLVNPGTQMISTEKQRMIANLLRSGAISGVSQ